MNFDRNSVIGFILMGILLIGYFIVTNKEQAAYQKMKAEEQKKEKARLDSLKAKNKPLEDSIAGIQDSLFRKQNSFQKFAIADSSEKFTVAENNLIRVTFTNKGGQIKQVELKQFSGQDKKPVRLAAGEHNGFSYLINTAVSLTPETTETGNLFFSGSEIRTNPDSSQTIIYRIAAPDSIGTSIIHEYTIRPNDYLIDFNIKIKGAERLLTQNILNLTWKYTALQQESDLSYEKMNTQVGYVEDGSFDYHTIGRRSKVTLDKNISWVGVRQRFFFGILRAKDNFSSGVMQWEIPADTTRTVVRSTAKLQIPVPTNSPAELAFNFYFGPSDYHILKKYGLKFEKLVNLGQGVYAFVRPINRFIIIPIFDFFNSLLKNPGLAIVLLTFFIRLLISPLTYSSYLSGAKMKALRPELDKLREKYGEDRQAMSIEQMKLFREAGVNPLGGCIPALLQIPIFFALYSFFNSEPSLRGAAFLWSKDLAAFDDPIRFGFHFPLLGSHLSLFNLLACVTSFLISWYSMSLTPDQSNPVLKYMPYIFPVMLLFFFNNLPSGLTWYYTVSNLMTLALQFVIQNYIIDHDKILAKIEENRKKPKAKSKWQERLEQMQEQQKKLREMQQKAQRKGK
ncbi:MAG: membrane protein insertase YidC [Chitinophagaceae bacterium]|nr:membrane protein insertase YidC [Chitinophagaceae bacterium]